MEEKLINEFYDGLMKKSGIYRPDSKEFGAFMSSKEVSSAFDEKGSKGIYLDLSRFSGNSFSIVEGLDNHTLSLDGVIFNENLGFALDRLNWLSRKKFVKQIGGMPEHLLQSLASLGEGSYSLVGRMESNYDEGECGILLRRAPVLVVNGSEGSLLERQIDSYESRGVKEFKEKGRIFGFFPFCVRV